jgi:hypothetical protein
MKRNLANVVAGMIMVLAIAVPMFAQRSGPVKVKIPFNFVVENDRLKAGDYTVEKIADGRLRIHNDDGSVSTIFMALPSQRETTPEQAHFIFHRYGKDYFLANIWVPGQQRGWELLRGKYESEIAKRKTVPMETAMVVGK